MMEPRKQPNDQTNSDRGENEKSEEYENFENAVRRIMRQSPDEAKKIRKAPVPKDPDGKNETSS